MGHVSDEEKKYLIATSHALLFPSLFEGFGLVILEAFMQKKPVLASDIRPLSDIIEHEKTGLLIPPHDEQKWANAISNMITNTDDTKIMGELARKTLEEHYTEERMGRLILEMYQEVGFPKKD